MAKTRLKLQHLDNSGASLSPFKKLGLEKKDAVIEIWFLQKCLQYFGMYIVELRS